MFPWIPLIGGCPRVRRPPLAPKAPRRSSPLAGNAPLPRPRGLMGDIGHPLAEQRAARGARRLERALAIEQAAHPPTDADRIPHVTMRGHSAAFINRQRVGVGKSTYVRVASGCCTTIKKKT